MNNHMIQCWIGASLLRFSEISWRLEWYRGIPRRRWAVSWADMSRSETLWRMSFWILVRGFSSSSFSFREILLESQPRSLFRKLLKLLWINDIPRALLKTLNTKKQHVYEEVFPVLKQTKDDDSTQYVYYNYA